MPPFTVAWLWNFTGDGRNAGHPILHPHSVNDQTGAEVNGGRERDAQWEKDEGWNEQGVNGGVAPFLSERNVKGLKLLTDDMRCKIFKFGILGYPFNQIIVKILIRIGINISSVPAWKCTQSQSKYCVVPTDITETSRIINWIYKPVCDYKT